MFVQARGVDRHAGGSGSGGGRRRAERAPPRGDLQPDRLSYSGRLESLHPAFLLAINKTAFTLYSCISACLFAWYVVRGNLCLSDLWHYCSECQEPWARMFILTPWGLGSKDASSELYFPTTVVVAFLGLRLPCRVGFTERFIGGCGGTRLYTRSHNTLCLIRRPGWCNPSRSTRHC